jgi:hypothetical protein
MNVYYSDTETFVQNGQNHELYLLGFVSSDSDYCHILNTCDNKAEDVFKKFCDFVTKRGNRDAVVYFHNLKYDYTILKKYMNITKIVRKDGEIYSVKFRHRGARIECKDSFKIISFGLDKFSKEFDLGGLSKKEALAYEYYNRERNDVRVRCDEYKKYLPQRLHKQFDENMKIEPSHRNGFFNPTDYYVEYLKLDCLVLKHGLVKFDEIVREITEGKMSVFEYLTISSLTDNYMKIKGCYDGCFEIQGHLREFCARACYGGRCIVNPLYKKKIIETGPVVDLDGCSLYPSSMKRLCQEMGIVKGKARLLEKPGDWFLKDYSILSVKITKIGKRQQIPFIAYRDETGVLQYTNEVIDLPEKLYVDSITLEDYIKFHRIEYQVVEGIFWNDGFNTLLGDVVQELFTSRLKAKQQKKKALGNVIKLMMNSIYGKTMIKQNFEEIIYKPFISWKKHPDGSWEKIDNTPIIDEYISNNFNSIIMYQKLNEMCMEITISKPDFSFNRAHIGCSVLSMSKRIMNELFDTANENDISIFYTDTDSMHLFREDVKQLEKKFEEKYKRRLNGKGLCQFHPDFDLDGSCGEIYATKSIFLGKKSYVDILESVDKDGNKIHGLHYRLKGITDAGICHQADKYKNGIFGIYEDLSRGNEVEFILNPQGKKVLFDFSEGGVRTKGLFKRKVKF